MINPLQSDARVRELLHHKARLMARPGVGPRPDVADAEQDLQVELAKAAPKFDPDRGSVMAYATVVLCRALARFERDRRAAKRTASIKTLNETLTRDERAERAYDLADLALDLAPVLAALPPELRDLADRLSAGTIAKVARDLNVPRSSLQCQIAHLRRAFEDAGLEEYLPNFRHSGPGRSN